MKNRQSRIRDIRYASFMGRMAVKEDRIPEFVTDSCPIKPRKINPQNVVVRLRRRETMGCPYPGTHVHNARQFYQNIFPNFTVMNVEKPPCFLRKFSPDGKYLIAFSADQTSIEVYEYCGASAAADLLADCEGEYIGHKNDDCSFHIRSNIFARFFKVLEISCILCRRSLYVLRKLSIIKHKFTGEMDRKRGTKQRAIEQRMQSFHR